MEQPSFNGQNQRERSVSSRSRCPWGLCQKWPSIGFKGPLVKVNKHKTKDPHQNPTPLIMDSSYSSCLRLDQASSVISLTIAGIKGAISHVTWPSNQVIGCKSLTFGPLLEESTSHLKACRRMDLLWRMAWRQWNVEPDALILDCDEEIASTFGNRHRIPVIHIESLKGHMPDFHDMMDFFEASPSSNLCRVSHGGMNHHYILRVHDGDDGLLRIKALGGMRQSDAAILIKRSISFRYPESLRLAKAACKRPLRLGLKPSKISPPTIPYVPANNFAKGFHSWKRIRNRGEFCSGCKRVFCPHRSFPYYVTSSPDVAPRTFRCPECSSNRMARSVRLTSEACEALLKRCLA